MTEQEGSLRLYACGSNGSAQLSLHHSDDTSTLTPCVFHPSYVPPPDYSILDITSASTHSLLLINTVHGNILFGAGTNTLGQLGPKCALWDDNVPQDRFKPISLVKDVMELEVDEWEPVEIASTWTTSFVVYQKRPGPSSSSSSGQGSSSAVAASSGSASRVDDQAVEQIVLACGTNDFGELGQVDTNSGDGLKVSITRPSDNSSIVPVGLRPGETIKKIRGGQRHVIVLIDGPEGQKLVGWGASRKGELHPSYRPEPSRPGDQVGRSRGKGKGNTIPPVSPPIIIDLDIPDGVNIVDIALGASHSVALLSDGSIRAWGNDSKGQITNLESVSNAKKIAATWGGTYHLDTNGKIWSQGSNSHSQLLRTISPSTPSGEVELDLKEGERMEDIVAGSEHLLVIVKTPHGRELYSGGWNEHGNLGLGHTDDQNRLRKVAVDGKVKKVWGGLAATWVWTQQSG